MVESLLVVFGVFSGHSFTYCWGLGRVYGSRFAVGCRVEGNFWKLKFKH